MQRNIQFSAYPSVTINFLLTNNLLWIISHLQEQKNGQDNKERKTIQIEIFSSVKNIPACWMFFHRKFHFNLIRNEQNRVQQYLERKKNPREQKIPTTPAPNGTLSCFKRQYIYIHIYNGNIFVYTRFITARKNRKRRIWKGASRITSYLLQLHYVTMSV